MSLNPEHFGNKSNMTRRTGKTLQGDLNETLNNQLNTSSSKMQYSFPQAERFKQKSTSVAPNKFYNLPSLRSSRATSFGYGNKYDLAKKSFLVPSPNAYTIRSSFQKKQHQGISMRLGRNEVNNVSIFSRHAIKYPAPTAYQNRIKDNNNISYSMGAKLRDLTDRWIKNVPGPGTYQKIELMNKDIKSPISKIPSCPSTRIGRALRKGLGQKPFLVPGVGSYNVQTDLTQKSQFKVPKGSKFGSGKRKGLSDQTMQTPGPGSYNYFSQFLK